MNLSLRFATTDDIPAALELCRISGWNQLAVDWERLLEYEPAGCFVAESDDRLVGTVTTTRYGIRLAWIGMMLVHPDYRRRGIATKLMNRSLEYLQDCGVECIKLDATPEGQHVYEKLGFTAEWSLRRWTRLGTSRVDSEGPDHPSPSMDTSTLQAFYELDRRGFGVDRSEWIKRLLPSSVVQFQPQALGLLRRGFLASYLGPLIASDVGDARLVVQQLVKRTGDTIFWDIPDPNQAAVDLAGELQFRPVRHLMRMWTGSQHVQSDLSALFALADPSTG